MKNKRKNISKEDWEDVESPALPDEMLSRLKPVRERHPDIPKRGRGPQKEPIKVPVSIRLSPEIVEYFKSLGKGWQTKINDILRDYIKTHEPDVTRQH
ncbi:BrnA antitoxin family protein [candidate division KSB1 bacterium]|nr:BrnA antitoxin family protein [candidate division KSB1 bacterium]NIR70782.1 BrnA antitoxin family protein [candidate division KSB1 bacterium]NIS27797.1 BrnA antitoxin family protein [candidate division KSB1 bacterium]NIT74679.1 BrnA antitoxin family protein [candidate division KSB1 bacterium]NIU28464.1 BrnA antitoxin family protein [candidate division KSB1 bacterium]